MHFNVSHHFTINMILLQAFSSKVNYEALEALYTVIPTPFFWL